MWWQGPISQPSSSTTSHSPQLWPGPLPSVRVQGKQASESGLLGKAIQWLAHESL